MGAIRAGLVNLGSYAVLFLWSFLAATVLPLGSEGVLVVLVRTEHQLILPVVVATLGNYLGACTTYWLGKRAARALGKRRVSAERHTRASNIFQRRGPLALVLSWVPVLGDALVVVAGAAQVPWGIFSFWVVLGKALRYAVVAWAALTI